MPSTNRVLASLALLTACGGGMPIEEARLADVAIVDGVALDGATLEQLMLSAPLQARPSPQAANLFISTFVDAAVLRGLLADTTRLLDSAMVRAAIMPDAMLGVIREGMRARINEMPAVTDEQADSLGRLGSVRVLQQVMLRVQDFQDSLEEQRVRDKLSALMRELEPGNEADFYDLARRYSEDSSTAQSGGLLPAVTRDELPDGPLAEAAWRLTPGEHSRPAVSPGGVHVLRRLTAVEGREALKVWLAPRLAAQQDSMWMDSVRAQSNVVLAEDAVERARELVLEPFSGGGDAPYATWARGELSPERVRMWFSILPAPERAGLPFASDSTYSTFLRDLVDRELRWQSTGETDEVPNRAWQALAPQLVEAFTGIVENYRNLLLVGDSSIAVRQFLKGAADGTITYVPLPGALGLRLRDGADVRINRDVLDAIVASATQGYALSREQDSLALDSTQFADPLSDGAAQP